MIGQIPFRLASGTGILVPNMVRDGTISKEVFVGATLRVAPTGVHLFCSDSAKGQL
jgi:hypothetical protein